MTGKRRGFNPGGGKLVRESAILSMLNSLQKSVGKLFSALKKKKSANDGEKTADKGFFASLYDKADIRKKVAAMKLRIADAAQNSAAGRLYRGFINGILLLSMQTIAIFLLTFGFYSLGIVFIKSYVSGIPQTTVNAIIGAACILFSLFFIGCGDNLKSKLSGSGIFKTLFVRILGIDEKTLIEKPGEKTESFGALAVTAGSVLGVLTYFVPAYKIAATAAIIVCVLAIIRFPETGLLASLLLFPLIPEKITAVLVCFTFFSYLLRLARGKRNFRFGKADLIYAVFAVFTITLMPFTSSLHLGMRLCFSCVFLLCVNLLRSEKLAGKAYFCFACGISIYSLNYIFSEFFVNRGIIPGEYLGTIAEAVYRPVSASVLVIALVIISLSLMFPERTGGMKTLGVLLFAVAVFALLTLGDTFAVYAALAAFALFFAVSSRKIIATAVGTGIFSLAAIGFVNVGVNYGIFSQTPVFAEFSSLSARSLPALIFGAGDGAVRAFGVVENRSALFTLASEGGVFYMILPFAAGLYITLRALKLFKKQSGKYPVNRRAGLICVVFTFLICGIAWDVFSDGTSQFAFWAALGILSVLNDNASDVS